MNYCTNPEFQPLNRIRDNWNPLWLIFFSELPCLIKLSTLKFLKPVLKKAFWISGANKNLADTFYILFFNFFLFFSFFVLFIQPVFFRFTNYCMQWTLVQCMLLYFRTCDHQHQTTKHFHCASIFSLCSDASVPSRAKGWMKQCCLTSRSYHISW